MAVVLKAIVHQTNLTEIKGNANAPNPSVPNLCKRPRRRMKMANDKPHPGKPDDPGKPEPDVEPLGGGNGEPPKPDPDPPGGGGG